MQGGEFAGAHAEQAKAEDDLVPESNLGAVLGGRDQAAEGLVMGEPASGVLALLLAVDALVAAKGTVRGEQVDARVMVGVAGSLAPGEEGAHAADPLANGVVGEGRPVAGTPVDEVDLGEVSWMLALRGGEQVREL